MDLSGKVAVVTGGAGGIGQALCRRFAGEGARAVVVADIDGAGAARVTDEVSRLGSHGVPVTADVSTEAGIAAVVERAGEDCGAIDLLCCNAGVAVGGGPETPDDGWERSWQVNVMAHVRATRAVLPGMLARGSGYLLHTASAAGLLTIPGAAPYAVTKHAVVALAEWLSITYGDAGIKVSCLCPQGVRTPMLMGGVGDGIGASSVMAAGAVIEPDEVAEAVVAGLAEERFLILPHPEVAGYAARRAADPEGWLAGMRRLQARLIAAAEARE